MYLSEIQDWMALTHEDLMRSISLGLHSTRTSATLDYHTSFFAGQQGNMMKIIGRSGGRVSMTITLHPRWSLLMKQARMIVQSTDTMDALLPGVVQPSMQILCEGTGLAWLLPSRWMGMRPCVLFQALSMGRNFLTLLSMMWCVSHSIPSDILLNYLSTSCQV